MILLVIILVLVLLGYGGYGRRAWALGWPGDVIGFLLVLVLVVLVLRLLGVAV